MTATVTESFQMSNKNLLEAKNEPLIETNIFQ